MPAMFDLVGSHPTLIHFAAEASRTVWKQIALCFLFNLASTFKVLFTTLLLLPNTFVALVIGIPNILSL
jgi:hypothetical protein